LNGIGIDSQTLKLGKDYSTYRNYTNLHEPIFKRLILFSNLCQAKVKRQSPPPSFCFSSCNLCISRVTPVYLGLAGGCITSTPKTADLREKPRKCPKYERSSCMPGQKNGERPYPEARKVAFWTPGLGPFYCPAYTTQPVFFFNPGSLYLKD